MSLLNTILEKLGMVATAATSSSRAPTSASSPSSVAPPASSGTTVANTATSSKLVDVAGKLDQMAASDPQKLNWKTSIIDLLKLLSLDSSLDSRKKLAQELGYRGALDGGAAMNMSLHKAVLQKLADNGGNIPKELLG